MEINIKEKDKKNKRIFTMLLISLFIFPQEFREGLLGNAFGAINILSIFSVFVFVLNNFEDINKFKLSLFYVTVLIYIFTGILYEDSYFTLIKCICSFILPLILIITKVKKEDFKIIFKISLKFINLIILIITILGIIEMVFKVDVNVYIGKLMSSRTQEQIIANAGIENGKRLYSFMGHPLFNTELYLIFLTLNLLYNKYLSDKKQVVWVLIISTIGIAFTGSKSGFMLLCTSILFLYKGKNLITKYLLIGFGIILTLTLGLFNTLYYRITTGSLTTGRSEMWLQVKQLNLFPIKFFTGYGNGFTFNFNYYLNWASAAFEYPFRMFSLEMGILITVFIYFFIMVIPIVILIKRRNFYILLGYLIVFVDVNTFNGIALTGDKMMILSLFIFLILGLSNIQCEKSNNSI